MIHLFGDKIKKIRKDNNLTQEQFGKIFNVAKNTVSYWEANLSKPDYNTILEIARYFGITTDYLYDFNQVDLDNMEKLKIALKEAGMLVGEDLTKEELEKALQIVEMMKDKKGDK